jgi:hypothetical protein
MAGDRRLTIGALNSEGSYPLVPLWIDAKKAHILAAMLCQTSLQGS